MDYLTYIVWRASDGTEWKDYHTLQADGPDEAEAKARALAEAITRSEHSDSDKHGFEYEGLYYACLHVASVDGI